jgi:hypothetical protein
LTGNWFRSIPFRLWDVASTDELRAAAEQVQDWPALVDLAERDRALAYVRRALTQLSLRIEPDAERALGAKLLGVRFSPEEARWERAVPARDVPGALMLSIVDQLVHLSVHVQKHGFNRLIWLKDIDLLLRIGTEADWRRAVQFHVADSWRGMLPSLVLLGHRRQRLKSIADAVFH